jgi:predicted membrane channel-forming protein YqfA (hemolysin III family)
MRKRELVPDFFREYKRFRHIGVPIYYVLAVIWLLYRARELGFLTGKNWFWLALPGVMLIVASWLYVVFTMKQMEQSDYSAASK